MSLNKKFKTIFSKKEDSVYHPLDKNIITDYNKIRKKDKRNRLCHAPFNSMTFFHTGDVLACWYNKFYPLGHYPEDSVHDIWFSHRAIRLREHIANNDLSYGCSECEKYFRNRNYYSTGAWRYDFLPETTNEYPSSIDFQISNKCNLACIMCNSEYSVNIVPIGQKKNNIKNPYDDKFFEQLKPFIPHLKEASFSGGETFIAEEFYHVFDLISAYNPRVKISATTNGTVLTDKVKSYLDKMLFNIAVSLDALTPDVYEKIRIGAKFESFMKNFEYFLDYTKKMGTELSVKTCPMVQNWKELPHLAQFLNKKNITFLYNTVFFPPYCALWSLSSKKLSEISEYLKSFKLSESNPQQKQNARNYLDLINQVDSWQKAAKQRESQGYYKMNLNELKDLFYKNVNDYIGEQTTLFKDNFPLKFEQIRDLVEQYIIDSPSDEISLKGMRFYLFAPIERLLSEIAIRDYEKNKEIFLRSGTEIEEF